MNYGLATTPTFDDSECLVLGIFIHGSLQDIPQSLDSPLQDLVEKLAKKIPEEGDGVWQAEYQGHSLLLVNCGKRDEFKAQKLRKRMDFIAAALIKQGISSATLSLPPVVDHPADWQLTNMLLQLDAQCYQLNDFKTTNKKPIRLESIKFHLPEANNASLKDAEAIAQGIQLTRTLADLPANRCTPAYLAEQALALSQQLPDIKTSIMEPEEMQKLGMGALLAVAQGSVNPPRLIELKYQGGSDSAPIVLVGKGITFDSGGLSLKPADAMVEMKYDMSGAASVLGTIKACALLKLRVNVIGLIACAENMPDGKAVKPGDIVTSLSGQTIEILNTDAEGRLVLADALTYSKRYNPKMVLDIATLTGAMVVALGAVNTGFMTQDDVLASRILMAAEASGDKIWRMPLDEAYEDALDSPLADMVNASLDRTAGAITAACFLSRFTKNLTWAHLDIAGTAWVSGKKRQATGRPVPLLVEFLRHAANTH